MTKEQEAQQAQTIADHEAFAAKFKEFASEPQNELSKQSEEVLQSKLNQAEKSLIDLQAQEIARLESKKTQVFQVCRANIKWQREQRKLQAQKIAEQAKEIELLREYKEAVETEVLLDKEYSAPDESWVDAVGVKLKALEQTTDSKEVTK